MQCVAAEEATQQQQQQQYDRHHCTTFSSGCSNSISMSSGGDILRVVPHAPVVPAVVSGSTPARAPWHGGTGVCGGAIAECTGTAMPPRATDAPRSISPTSILQHMRMWSSDVAGGVGVDASSGTHSAVVCSSTAPVTTIITPPPPPPSPPAYSKVPLMVCDGVKRHRSNTSPSPPAPSSTQTQSSATSTTPPTCHHTTDSNTNTNTDTSCNNGYRTMCPSTSCKALLLAVNKLYRLDDFHMEKIGSGFFSDVYKVCHKGSGEVFALKMNTQRGNRLNSLREVQLMNRLTSATSATSTSTTSHPNILRFCGVCVDSGQLHALTQYVNGGSLEQVIPWSTSPHRLRSTAPSEPLPWISRVRLSLDMASGLHYLHTVPRILHRDLTSKNILIQFSGCGTGGSGSGGSDMRAIIGDFGLATRIPPSPPHSAARLPIVGSPWWMAPECLQGQYYNEKADVFSLGIILCEVISGAGADPDILPRTSNYGVDYNKFTDTLTPHHTPALYLHLTFRCCAVDVGKRPSAGDIVPNLKLLLKQLSPPSSPTTSTSPTSQPITRDNPTTPTATSPTAPSIATAVTLRDSPGRRWSDKQRTHSLSFHCLPHLHVGGVGAGATGGKVEVHVSAPGTPAPTLDLNPEAPSQPGDAPNLHPATTSTPAAPTPHHTLYKFALCGDIYTSRRATSTVSQLSPRHIGEIMSQGDPYYVPNDSHNPFTATRFKDGRKLIGSLSSSCFEHAAPFTSSSDAGSDSHTVAAATPCDPTPAAGGCTSHGGGEGGHRVAALVEDAGAAGCDGTVSCLVPPAPPHPSPGLNASRSLPSSPLLHHRHTQPHPNQNRLRMPRYSITAVDGKGGRNASCSINSIRRQLVAACAINEDAARTPANESRDNKAVRRVSTNQIAPSPSSHHPPTIEVTQVTDCAEISANHISPSKKCQDVSANQIPPNIRHRDLLTNEDAASYLYERLLSLDDSSSSREASNSKDHTPPSPTQ